MNLKTKILLVLLFFIFLLFPFFSRASENERIIVQFRSQSKIFEAESRYGLSGNQVKKFSNLSSIRITNPTLWQKAKLNYSKFISREVKSIEPDYQYKIQLVPNDTSYSEDWGLPKISATSAWDITTGSSSMKIATVDTGVDGLHTELLNKVLAGYDYVNSQEISANSNSDDEGHGTAVSGVAAAIGNNGTGIAGMDWQTKIIPVKVLDSDGVGFASDIASGITYAADNGAKVINLSLGGSSPSSVMESAINYAINDKGCIIVAAAGNEGSSVSYPAKYSGVMAIGATNSSDSIWSGSNFGPEISVVAPGVSIYTTYNNGGYITATGTSLATPYVTGLASLLWSIDPNSTNEQIKNLIKNNADKVSGMGGNNFTNYYGYGRINAYKSFTSQGTFNASFVSQSVYPTLKPGDVADLQVTFKNAGTATWYSSNNPVLLATDHHANESFMSGFNYNWINNNRLTGMQQTPISNGENATFSFSIKVPSDISPGKYRFYVRLVAEGLTWFENPDTNGGAWWEITIPTPTAQWVSQSGYIIGWPGEQENLSVTFKNTTGTSWSKTSPPTNLAIDSFGDQSFLTRFQDSTWLSSNRIASLPQDQVANGDDITYNFVIKIPNDLGPGTYRFFVRLVQDGFSWFNNPDTNGGAWWQITIPSPSAKWVSQSVYPTLAKGETKTISVQFKNNTGHTWPIIGDHPVLLGLDKNWAGETVFKANSWITSNRITAAQEGTVPDGGNGTYSFEITAPADIASGNYKFYVRLVSENFAWFDNPDTNGAAWWEITVQ